MKDYEYDSSPEVINCLRPAATSCRNTLLRLTPVLKGVGVGVVIEFMEPLVLKDAYNVNFWISSAIATAVFSLTRTSQTYRGGH